MANKDNIISYKTYRNYISRIEMIGLKEVVEKLKGKRVEEEYNTIDDCGVYFVSALLDSDCGRTIVYAYDEMELDFINSKYLSDYFKDSIKELLEGTMSEEIESILNSSKTINQMSEEEIKKIYDAIVEYYRINGKSPKSNISSKILTYLYKLDGKGVTSFIKNNINGEDIARQMLLTSGLNSRASYYSGRGVNYSDLNEDNLVAIFQKLLRFDEKFALSFVDMVCGMKTLGATEFINSFIRLGANKFEYNSKNIDESNVSLDGVSGRTRDAVAFVSIFSTMNGRDDEYQKEASKEMKLNFLKKIRNIFENIREDVRWKKFMFEEYGYNAYDDWDYSGPYGRR